MGIEADLLEQRHHGGNQHLAPGPGQGAGRRFFELIQHLQRGGQVRVGIIAHVHRTDVGLFVVEIQILHLILPAFMHINCILMQKHGHGEAIHFADDPVLLGVGNIHDQEILVAGGAQGDARLGEFLRHPVIPAAHVAQNVLLAKVFQQFLRGRFAFEIFPVHKGQLVGGALDVVHEDVQIFRIDQRVFRGLAKEVIRMSNHVLIQRAGGGHHNQQRGVAPATGPARLLPGAGDGAGIAAQHAGVQLADVDAQFQGVGGNHGGDPARPKLPFDFPALGGQIAAPIPPNPARVAQRIPHQILQIAHQHLHRQSGTGEDDVRNVVFQKIGGDVPGFGNGARPNAQLGVYHRRIVKHHVAFPGRCAVFVDEQHFPAGHGLRQFPGIANGGGTADENRIGAVKPANALQAADDVGQVGAENAPVSVNFVNDHIAQVFKELYPLGVMGQNALMQHVGVGHHHVSRLANGRACGGGGVPVVGIGLDLRAHGIDHGIQLRGLVAGQGLGGEKIQRPCGGVL